MKNQWFCLFFDDKSWCREGFSQQKVDSERNLPLYLLSWLRDIILYNKNEFLCFLENTRIEPAGAGGTTGVR